MTVPCKGCRERRAATKTTLSCHADCERYRAFWDENRRRDQEKLRELDLNGMKIEGMLREDRITRRIKGKPH